VPVDVHDLNRFAGFIATCAYLKAEIVWRVQNLTCSFRSGVESKTTASGIFSTYGSRLWTPVAIPALLLVKSPLPDSLDASGHVISQLVHPESHHIPSKLDQSHIAELIAPQEFPVPVAVIPLAINLDVQLPSLCE
jgi:hypothetical protein